MAKNQNSDTEFPKRTAASPPASTCEGNLDMHHDGYKMSSPILVESN